MITIASDHHGVKSKVTLKQWLDKHGYLVQDLGPFKEVAVDYPEYAHLLCKNVAINSTVDMKKVQTDIGAMGILICGSGIGMSMVANRHHHIRAALCRSSNDAEMARLHNDANVIVFGSNISTDEDMVNMLSIFVKTKHEGGRHEARVNKFNINI